MLIRSSLFSAFLMVSACGKHDLINGDGVYEVIKKGMFPRYTLLFAKKDFSQELHSEFKIDGLPKQQSIMGIKLQSTGRNCEEKYFEYLKDIKLGMTVYDSDSELVVSDKKPIANWVWSYPKYNKQLEETSTCILYSRNMYFVPEADQSYVLSISTNEVTTEGIVYQPFISSVATYSL